MRFGAVTFIWTSPFDTAALGVVDRIADIGFDVAEIALEQPGLCDPGALRDVLARRGLEPLVLAFCTSDRDTSGEDAALRRAGLDYLRAAVDFAAAIGAGAVCGPLAAAVGRTRLLSPAERARERAWAVEGVREAGHYAGERGISLGVEPLNRFETDMLNTVEQGVVFVEEVGLANVGLLLDTFHQGIEERSQGAAIRSAGSHIVHFHASANDRGVPGDDQVEWDDVAAALRGVGYDGVISLESFVGGIPELARAVSLWRPLYNDPDDFAAAGLANLERIFGGM